MFSLIELSTSLINSSKSVFSASITILFSSIKDISRKFEISFDSRRVSVRIIFIYLFLSCSLKFKFSLFNVSAKPIIEVRGDLKSWATMETNSVFLLSISSNSFVFSFNFSFDASNPLVAILTFSSSEL